MRHNLDPADLHQSADRLGDAVASGEMSDAAEAANASEVCAAINELRSQRDAARFEAARARGEARSLELALKETQKQHKASRRAVVDIQKVCRTILSPETSI